MKHLKILAVLFMSSALLFSCKREARLSAAEQAAEDFFTVMASDKSEDVAIMYPKFSEIDDPYSPDSVSVKGSEALSPTLTKVMVNGYVHDSTGTKERELAIYVSTDTVGNVLGIDNSLGFCKAEEHELCILAENIGAVNGSDTTDIMVQNKLEEVAGIYDGWFDKVVQRYKGIEVSNVSWKQLVGGAEGTISVKNDSKYNVDNLKYCVNALDKEGNVLACDTSMVSLKGVIESGAVAVDKFAILYEGKAKTVDVELLYDAEELAKEDILEAKYTGNEYQEYLNTIEEEEAEKEEAEKIKDLNL